MTDTIYASSIVSMMLNAPLVATTPARRVLHAVDMDGIPGSGRTTCDARCGKRVKIVTTPVAGGQAPALWPPRVRSLADGVTVCPDCRRRSERPRDRDPIINCDMLEATR